MSTTLIRSFANLTPVQRNGVMTIGNFDGVHLGHQALLARLTAYAHQVGRPSLVMTFEPHPDEFFAGDNIKVARLTRLREKYLQLSACGVDHVLIIPFNQHFASLLSSDFITNWVQPRLAPSHILIGDDFRFGQGRQGNFASLSHMGENLGFTVEAMPTYFIDDERVSSTRVRQALAQGDHALVKRLLGHPYAMLGRIRRGDQIGRQLGFPTANIFLHRKMTPVHGIYTVRMHGIAEQPLLGVANVGTRPTVDGTRTLLEVHLFDFNKEIYGRYVEVEFCAKLRDEVKYSSLAQLKEAIANDVEVARLYFKKQGAL